MFLTGHAEAFLFFSLITLVDEELIVVYLSTIEVLAIVVPFNKKSDNGTE